MIEVGSEFDTDSAEHRKARVANSVVTKGLICSGTSDERSVCADSRVLTQCTLYTVFHKKPGSTSVIITL